MDDLPKTALIAGAVEEERASFSLEQLVYGNYSTLGNCVIGAFATENQFLRCDVDRNGAVSYQELKSFVGGVQYDQGLNWYVLGDEFGEESTIGYFPEFVETEDFSGPVMTYVPEPSSRAMVFFGLLPACFPRRIWSSTK